MLYRMAMARGRTLATIAPRAPPVQFAEKQRPRGISVVIPSRNGRDLLERCLPGIQDADEIIVVDNGSDDGTVEYLGRSWPQVLIEHSPQPLAFAVAVNRGIRRARFSHVCVLNNDMVIEPGFFRRCCGRSRPSRICSAPPPRSFSPKAAAAKRPARP